MSRRFLVILAALVVLVLVIEVTDYIWSFGEFDFVNFLRVFPARIRAEVITVAFSVLILEFINRRRLLEMEKRSLLLQLGSPNNAFAVEAARILRVRGWLSDGSLRGLFLAQANLQGAALWRADMQDAELIEAQLQGANLHKINLYGANLWEADLTGAELIEARLYKTNLQRADLHDAKLWGADLRRSLMEQADLQGANLRNANLRNTLLIRADLRGANLNRANLRGVDLSNARFDAATLLPDGTHWTAESDLRRFVDSRHPDFWRPDLNESDPPTWYRIDMQQGDDD